MGEFFLKEPKGILPCAMKRRNPHSGCLYQIGLFDVAVGWGFVWSKSFVQVQHVCDSQYLSSSPQGHLSSPFQSSVSSSSSNSDIFSPKMYNKMFNKGYWVHSIELAFQFLVNTMLHHNSDKKSGTSY